MTIIYTVISRLKDATVLVEVADSDIKGGNLSQIFIRMIEYFRDHNTNIFSENGIRKTFVQRSNDDDDYDFLSYFVEACTTTCITTITDNNYKNNQLDEYYIHIYYYDGILYSCLSDDSDVRDHKVSFAYLETLHKDFIRMFRTGRINKCKAYTLDKEFTVTVRSIVHYHNVNHNKIRQEERVRVLEAKVITMKSILGNNITLLIQRNENLEILHNKSNDLEDKVQVFRKSTKLILKQQKYKYYTYHILIGLCILFAIYIGLIIPCGLLLQKCEVTTKSNRRRLLRQQQHKPRQLSLLHNIIDISSQQKSTSRKINNDT